MPAPESHSGLLKKTIPWYNKRTLVNISNALQKYSIFGALVRNAKKAVDNQWDKFNFGLPREVTNHGGTDYRFNVQVDSSDSFSWVNSHTPINIDERDYEQQVTVVKRMCRDHWSYNKTELADCAGPEELTSLVTTRSMGRDQGTADSLENWGWGPPPASTDTETGWPIRYWLFSAAESTIGTAYTGFTSINNGGQGNFLNANHASYTSGPGGLSRATYPQWGNWNCQYTTFNDTDGLEKLTYAILSCNFQTPYEFPNMVEGAPNWALYSTTANKVIYGRLARQQNDQNGSDPLARLTDNEIFRVPMFRLPQLDSSNFSLYSSSNKDVIYGMDWSTWYWMTNNGFQFEDEILDPSREAPLDYTHFRYLRGNLCCIEPRRNFVLSK